MVMRLMHLLAIIACADEMVWYVCWTELLQASK